MKWIAGPSQARRTGIAAHKLSRMALTRGAFSQIAVGVLCISACRDTRTMQSPDSTKPSNSSPAVTAMISGTGWDSTAGPVMIIPASKGLSNAAIVLPGFTDSSLASTAHFELGALDKVKLDLFSSEGLVGSATLHVVSQAADPSGCLNWPTGHLTDSLPTRWNIALEKGRAMGIPLNSMEQMQGADSARLVNDVITAATHLREGGDTVFHGIPFSVRKGYRLAIPGLSIIVAEVVRKINEEANPREEHLLLISERRVGDSDYRVVFHARSAGAEESLEASDILAAFKLVASGRPSIVVSFDYEDGRKIGLVERIPENSWRIVWKSAYSGC
jgi:hypothetical protein